MSNAIITTNEKSAKKMSGKQLRLPPIEEKRLAKILSIVDAVQTAAKVEGVIDSKTANAAMQVKIGEACLLGAVVGYNGKSRAFTIKARFNGEIISYTVSTTGNKLVSYLVDEDKDGEAATGYDTTYIKRLKVLTETGSLIPCLSYIGQIRKQSFDVLGAFFKKEFGDFKKLFGANKLTELEKLIDTEATFTFGYNECEDALKYRDYLQEIVTNDGGKYAPEFVKKAQDKLAEINGGGVKVNLDKKLTAAA